MDWILKRKKWIILGITLVLISIISSFFKKGSYQKCEFDGANIIPLYEVDLIFDTGIKRFCSIPCAITYLKVYSKGLKYVTLVDEVTGNKIDSKIAYFVKSNILKVTHTNDKIHVFSDEQHANAHKEQFHGKIIKNPFEKYLFSPMNK